MQWLVDIDTAVANGTLTVGTGEELKRRSKEAMVEYAINLALFAGILMVIGGSVVALEDRRALAALGMALAAAGAVTPILGGARVHLLANATGIIGAALAVAALASLLFKESAEPVRVGIALGLPAVVLGWTMRRLAPTSLSVLGGWILLLGGWVHIVGVLRAESEFRLEWLVLHYVGAVIIACGVFLNVRIVTAAAIVPLAAALSSAMFYDNAIYSVAIYEVTLTVLQMSVIALLALAVATHTTERLARHARILGQLALIWINMAFWIGSLWGDAVGLHLLGPKWSEVTGGLVDPHAQMDAWTAALDAFRAHTIEIHPDVFAALWAIGILAVGAWAALTARREVLNIVVTFGAIHFYTQYFERLEATPEVVVVAGTIAILAAWGLWMVNRSLARSTLENSSPKAHEG